MSWRQAGSRWQSNVRKDVVTWLFLGLPLFAAAIIFYEKPHSWISGIFLLISFMMFGLCIRAYRRCWRIIHVVPTTDGAVCPWCLDKIDDTPVLPACPKCHRRFDPVELQRYWIRYGLDRGKAIANTTLALVTTKGKRRNNRHIHVINFWGNHWNLAFQLTLLIGLVVFNTYYLQYRTLLFNVFYAFRALGFIIAFSLLMPSDTRRQGLTKCCAKCEYPHTPGIEIPDKCPECGTPWLELGEYQIGIAQKSDTQRNIAIILLIVWGIVILTTVDIPAFLQSIFKV